MSGTEVNMDINELTLQKLDKLLQILEPVHEGLVRANAEVSHHKLRVDMLEEILLKGPNPLLQTVAGLSGQTDKMVKLQHDLNKLEDELNAIEVSVEELKVKVGLIQETTLDKRNRTFHFWLAVIIAVIGGIGGIIVAIIQMIKK